MDKFAAKFVKLLSGGVIAAAAAGCAMTEQMTMPGPFATGQAPAPVEYRGYSQQQPIAPPVVAQNSIYVIPSVGFYEPKIGVFFVPPQNYYNKSVKAYVVPVKNWIWGHRPNDTYGYRDINHYTHEPRAYMMPANKNVVPHRLASPPAPEPSAPKKSKSLQKLPAPAHQ